MCVRYNERPRDAVHREKNIASISCLPIDGTMCKYVPWGSVNIRMVDGALMKRMALNNF